MLSDSKSNFKVLCRLHLQLDGALLHRRRGQAAEANGELATELDAWWRIVKSANWDSLQDVRKVYKDADGVTVGSLSYTVFNIRHNRFRLIVQIAFERQTVFVKFMLTNKEYDRDGWKQELLAEQRERERKVKGRK